MPHLTCGRCGSRIDLTRIPALTGFEMISEAVFEAAIDAVVSAAQQTQDAKQLAWMIWHDIFGPGKPGMWRAFICPTCGRLYLFKHKVGKPDAIYDLNQGDVPTLLEDAPEEPQDS